MEHFSIKILTHDNIFYNGEIIQVDLPGKMGYFGILPKHAPIIAALSFGIIKLFFEDGKTKEFFIDGGIAETDDKSNCSILADFIVNLRDFKPAKYQEKLAALKKTILYYPRQRRVRHTQ